MSEATDRLAARIAPYLRLCYPRDHAEVTRRLVTLAEAHAVRTRPRTVARPTEETGYLITYGGGVRRRGEAPLRTLAGFLDTHVGERLSDVHLLPIFPWTSDDGFAVVDHRVVDPALGAWHDVDDLAARHGVMLDFVANHTSSRSPWFRDWLAEDASRAGFYLARDADFDVSRVVRPRTTPLFHPFLRPDGRAVEAWTTFGPDQVDVDVRHPATLLELTDVLLGYVARGASAVRLDAIGFLWKESGTSCLHLPATHAVVKTWRALVDHVAPGTRLVTETNVPHAENISYFGDGDDEAGLVYQFALPPLVLHSFVAGSTALLGAWADTVGRVSGSATWLNFLASHDGIGLRATEGILDDAQREELVRRTLAHGGEVSWAGRPGAEPAVYELNLGYLDALCTPAEAADPEVLAAKAVAAHAILFALLGVPAVYLHSLVGSPPDRDAVARSGVSRRINRAVLDADRLEAELRDDPRRRGVFTGLGRLLDVRRRHDAFSPFGTQRVERLDDRVLALRRGVGTAGELLCVTNVTGDAVPLEVGGTDVLTGAAVDALVLAPWGSAWLRPRR